MGKLEEIEKYWKWRKSMVAFRDYDNEAQHDIAYLLFNIHKLKAAIENALVKSQYSGFAKMEALENLKKALEGL